MHADVNQLIADQRGYVTRRQAMALGYSDQMIRTRLHRGDWRRVGVGIYIAASHRESVVGRIAVACGALGAAASHESAAELHGMQPMIRGRVVVTVAVRRTHEFPGTVVHQSTDLTEDYVDDVDGIPVTNPARTLYDLAAIVSRKRLVKVVDHALAQRKTTLHELWRILEQLARRGKPGTVALRSIVAALDPEYIPTESELEARVAGLMKELALPDPARQYPLPWRSEARGRVDFAFPERKLIVEADGRSWHSLSSAFDTDRMRDNLAQLAGWRVIRITWKMLADRQQEVESLLIRAVRSDAAA